MKILLVSPHINAQHKSVQLLKAKGMAVLLPTSPSSNGPAYYDEAWQIIQTHGASLDLVLIHRESAKGADAGIELVSKIKKDSVQHDLPILLTTETWSEEQCASHQQTPMGANAYLKWPVDEKTIIGTVEAILPSGERIATSINLAGLDPVPAASPAPMDTSGALSVDISNSSSQLPVSAPAIEAPSLEPYNAEISLEDPGQIFSKTTPKIEISSSSIKLESDAGFEFTTPRMVVPPSAPTDATSVALVTPEQEASVAIQVSSPISLGAGAPSDQSKANMTGLSLQLDQAVVTEASQGMGVEGATSVVQPAVVDSSDLSSSVQSSSQSQTFGESPDATNGDLGSSIESQMPYLFSKGKTGQTSVNAAVVSTFAHPLGDAIIPGGAVSSPDIETLKKYLLLREQDVAALSVQLKNAKDEAASLNHLLLSESSRAEELDRIVADQKRKLDDFEKEKAIALETLNSEIAEIRFQSKAKSDKAKLLEIQVQEASTEIERLKERVRSDIRKIRVRERELENKLEITKKDSEVVLAARESKIIELKRKIDLLEFNMDLLQDRYTREKDSSAKLREKLAKAAQVVRVAEGLLDEPQAASLKQTVESLTAESANSAATRGDKAS